MNASHNGPDLVKKNLKNRLHIPYAAPETEVCARAQVINFWERKKNIFKELTGIDTVFDGNKKCTGHFKAD